jgi:membrane protease YdiL (CAAX protease family)
MTATGAPPGWYPDPWHQSTWRWWDGHAWTAYTDRWYGSGISAPADRPLRAGGIAFLGFMVGIGLSTVIAVVLILMGYETTDPALLLGSQLGLWIGLAGSCVIAVKVRGTGSLADLGLDRPRWVDLAMGVGFGIVLVIGVAIIAATIQAIDENLLPGGRSDIVDPVEDGGFIALVVVYLIAVVGAPIFEELFFRGLVQGTFTDRWGFASGVVVQALLFGLVHLNPENGWGNVGTFVIITSVGIGLGIIRRYSGRLPPAMFTHAVYNAIIVTIAVLARDL